MTIDPSDDEALLARFRDWLRSARFEAQAIDGDPVSSSAGSEPEPEVGLFRLAEEFTVREIEGIMHNETPVAEVSCVLLYLEPEDYQRLANVLRTHGATKSGRGLVNKEKALMRIVAAAEKHAAESKGEEPPA